MLALLLAILCSTSIMIVFKLFDRFKVVTFEAIVVNYLVAAGLGFATLDPGEGFKEEVFNLEPWFMWTVLLGKLFISIFNVMGQTAQKVGVTWAAVANNMSLVIPVVAAVLLYSDSMPWLKLTGILLALVGVYLATKPGKSNSFDRKYLWLPILLFFSSGFLASLLNYIQTSVPDEQNLIFVPTIFAVAGILGVVALLVRGLSGKGWPGWRSLLGGIALGVPNYGSILFLVMALDSGMLEASQVFPLNNISVVAVAAVLAWIIFKERLTAINWIGVAVSVGSALLIIFHEHIL